jgi:sulfite reductase beta subunit-like hemoprotein
MSTEKTIEFDELYLQLKTKIDEFIAGTITADQLKPSSAVFGVIPQRNGQFMVRIRITGGHISIATAKAAAGVIRENGVGYVHLSTRQNIQLHDVAPDKIYSLMAGLDAIGLPFKGGGGNSYRNIAASPLSGFGTESIFDVQPYAAGLNAFFKYHKTAFALPRKYKIGFFASPQEALNASVQDLGFLAATRNGNRGFRVYAGGGMGRESALGIQLFDFLPEKHYIRCAVALNEMFNEHGNRENRNQARIRFLVKSLGEEGFTRLYLEYFERTPDYVAALNDVDYIVLADQIKPMDAPSSAVPGFNIWRQHAVSATKLGEKYRSVRIYVPHGNLQLEQLESLATLTEQYSCGFWRLTPTQDIILPLVHVDNLVSLYQKLANLSPELDLTLKSFRGHIPSCIGATVCKIGILDSPGIADAIAIEMDKILPADTPEKIRALILLTDNLKISGCPNCCGGHPAARIGIEGQKKRIDDVLTDVCLIYTGCSAQPDALKLSTPGAEAVKVTDLPGLISNLVQQLR